MTLQHKQYKIDLYGFDNFSKHVISCGLGILIGVAMHYIVPEFIGATSLIVAVISGGVSGIAATGSNQVLKQLMKSAEDVTLNIDTSDPPAKLSDEPTEPKE